jgi:cytochrome c553
MKRLTCLVLLTCISAAAAFGQDYMKAARTVDEFIGKALMENKVVAAAPASDAEFIRRVYLDIVGVSPSADEVTSFLRSGARDKREKLIVTLLNSELYKQHWAVVWEQWLIGRGDRRNSGVNRATIKSWLHDVVLARNLPYDEIVRQKITARGPTEENGPVNFFAKWGPNQADTAAATSRVFLGVRTSCARCHDHKFEKWKQEDFWSLAAFFSRTQGRTVRPRDDVNRPLFAVAEQPTQGDLSATVDDGPKQGTRVTAKTFLNGDAFSVNGSYTAREELARWMTSPGNPWFAQNIVNRMWDYFFGRGFVNPVDDFREGNPPSHPELLKFLAEDFAANGYNLKYLIAVITNTKTYQLSSGQAKAEGKEAADKIEKYFARAQLRPLSPEQMFYSIVRSLGEDVQRNRQQLERTKADYLRQFITLFDNDEQTEQTDFEATIPQALMMINGTLVNNRLNQSTVLTQLLNSRITDAQRINLIFLQTLNRAPTGEETALFARLMESRLQKALLKAQVAPPAANGNGGQRPNPQQAAEAQRKVLLEAQRQAYEDILWALVNSSEFVFIH